MNFTDFEMGCLYELVVEFLTIYIKIFILREGQNFSLFTCSIFRYFKWFLVWNPKTALLDSITRVILFRF